LGNFSNFGSLKSTETNSGILKIFTGNYFSNFGSLKSTETQTFSFLKTSPPYFSNFGSLKSTETGAIRFSVKESSAISAISAR